LAAQIDDLSRNSPARWHQRPCGRDARAGALLAFGGPADTRYQLENAQVILSLDGDFLTRGPGALAYARAFTAGRRVRGGKGDMNRLYVVESTPTNTGGMADHRLPLRATEIELFALALAVALGIGGLPGDAARMGGLRTQHAPAMLEKWTGASPPT
jgi:molybdopterin-containing oxidoreductase family iron-sulfur binding subunit